MRHRLRHAVTVACRLLGALSNAQRLRDRRIGVLASLSLLAIPALANADMVTYHLHAELGPTGARLLKVAPLDAASQVAQSADMKGLQAGGAVALAGFATAPFNRFGSVAGGVPITFNLWLRKTANVNNVVVRAWAGAFWGTNSGGNWCSADATPTTTLTLFTFTCNFPGQLFDQANTRITLTLNGVATKKLSQSVRVEVAFEGTPGGNYDSRVTVPIPPTTLQSLTPSSGPPGTPITVTGANFEPTQGSGAVRFNGTLATPSTWSSTSIVVPVPGSATSGPVVVTSDEIASNALNFTVTAPAPSISSLNPNSGSASQSVTINGANFGATQGTSTVTFNGVAASVTSWSSTSIGVIVPSAATTGPVVVTVGGQTSNGVTFTVIQPPSISSLSPTSGPIGQQVTIAGAHFGTTQGNSAVTFNGISATTTGWSDTNIGVTVPAGATTGPVVVTVNGQASNSVTFTVTTATPTSSIQYRYDSVGRLTMVIDRDGNSATYNYDAVGNLLSITRSTASVVTISGFSPGSGFAGASVTIAGSGFSSTPSENIVTVGGKPASITSSTANQIMLVVPVGASSGPISVVSPNGAAVSNDVFTVLGGGAPPNQPTISGFSPSSGASGTSVQITGTNFDPDLGDNTVLLNAAVAVVTNATPTTLTATVPSGASSGRVTIITPSGQVTSNTDFIVPPPSHPIGDIEISKRLVFGVPETVAVQQGKVAVYLLDGVADDWINFQIIYAGFAPYTDATLTLLDPSGVTLYTGFAYPTHPAIRVPATGTYSVVIDAVDGPAAFDLHVTRDVAETVVISTQSASVRVTVRDRYQNARVRIIDATGGAFGNRLAVRASDVGPYSSLVALMASDGTVLTSDYVLRTEGAPLLLDAPLAPGGTLTALFDPELDEIGSVTLNLLHPPADVTGSITPGVLTPISTTQAGQNARLLFTGTMNQRVSVKVDRVGDISIFTAIRLIAPNGAVLASGQLNSGMDFLDAVTLPADGTHVIEIDPPGENVGSVNVTLYNITDLSAAGTIGGAAVNLTFTTPGQNASITFDSSAGTKVGFAFTGISSALISVKSPDGSVLLAPISRPTFTDVTLTQTGTHTLVFDPSAMTTGAMGVTLTAVPADFSDTIIASGPSKTVVIGTAGQNAQVTFDAVGGQRVSLEITSVSIQWSTVKLKKPDGSALATMDVFTSGGFIDSNVLVDSGTYTIAVDPVREFTGSMTLTLHNVSSDATASASIDGPPVTLAVGTAGQIGAVTFAGTAGPRVAANLTSVSISSSNVSVLNPDGSVLIPATSMTTSGKFLDATLIATGTHIVRIDPVGTATGSVTVALTTVPADVTSSISIGGGAVASSITNAGQRARLSFTVSAGQRVSVQLSAVTIASSVVSIRRPDDTVLVSATIGTAGGFIDTNTLVAGGTYSILIDPIGTATGNMTAQLFDVPADLSGSITPGGGPVAVAIGNVGQNASLSFAGSVGLRVSLLASNVTASSVTISILRPSGSTLASMTVGTGGGFIDTRTLTDAGTFTIKVDPVNTTTGSVTLTLYQVPLDATATATVGGAGVAVNIGAPGQNAAVTFDAVVNQQVTVHITGNNLGSVIVKLLRTDNTTMTSRTSSLSAFDLTTQTIPITGPYRVTIDPASTAAIGSSLTVTVTSP